MEKTDNLKKNEDQSCYFCAKNLAEVDYKDTEVLRKFINVYMKILPRKKTHLCSAHQRKLAVSVKRARIMALIPFVSK